MTHLRVIQPRLSKVLLVAALLGPVFGWVQFCILGLITAVQRGELAHWLEYSPGLPLFLPMALVLGLLPGLIGGALYFGWIRMASQRGQDGAGISLLAAIVSGALAATLLLPLDDEWLPLQYAPLFGGLSGLLCVLCFLRRATAAAN